jgi:hypothetical protein
MFSMLSRLPNEYHYQIHLFFFQENRLLHVTGELTLRFEISNVKNFVKIEILILVKKYWYSLTLPRL